MKPFALKVVTPDGLEFEGQAEQLIVRTTSGDMGIMAGHINTVAPLDKGEVLLRIDGEKCYAACTGGMVSVINGAVTLLPITFQWKDNKRA